MAALLYIYKMETEKLNQNGDSTMDLSDDHSLNAESSDACGVFDEPELVPRVDDEYQVEIPALVTGPKYEHYLKSPIDVENRGHIPFDFCLGLSVPVTWNKNVNKVSGVLKNGEQENSGHSTDVFNSGAPLKFESVEEKMDPYQGSCDFLVPGVCGDIWNDIEEESFLLGLYIFGKEFSQLKRFVGSKKMEDILLLYHGKFYRSIEFTRWTKITKRRKVKSKKWAYGQRMFSGLRLKELLSRILPQVSEECKKELKEVSTKFAEVCISLEDYVSSLKAIVGIQTFIEAVAIGKGKKDLTSMASAQLRPEVPIDKPYSSLTRTEIIDILTGGDRLSKAKASNLFWDAVWPRLLDRGWQSEKPKNQAYVPGANNSLVFLTPGVKKFSKSRLVKGTHYYVSVTDILSKVVSEPELLKLDTEEDEGKKKDEDGWVEMNNVQEKLPEKRHCYLQPRTPSRDMYVVKFTVVDTSLANGEVFRELRTLPKDVLKMKSFSEDSDNGTSEVSTNGSDCAYNMFVNQETKSTTSEKNLSERGKTLDSSSSDQQAQIRGPDSLKLVKKSQPNKLYGDEQTRNPVKGHLSQKSKRKNLDSLASATKRHRTIFACSNEEMGYGRNTLPLVAKSGEDAHGFCTDNHDPNDKALEIGSSQDRLSFTISPKDSSPQSTEGAQNDICHGPENPQSRPIIDLNLPQEPVEFDDGIFMTGLTNMQNDITSKQKDDFCAPKTSADIGVPEHPININSRRQSTRNRPPTARALEALVNGYLTAATRRKDAHEASRSRPPKRIRRQVAATDVTTHDAVVVGESGTRITDAGNINTCDKLQFLSSDNGSHISNP
ncbi:SANT domain-containing protein [Heracleum sosnowskyi]|uniref:SANT domain-containing protein n=1 Tax=Heracleum sosnowskyi TaxID=360622 RepID=A0AAD8IKL5_9APIA|nr:SANT domain-containing protein [Heracleum sosnowskyi]